MAESHGPLPLCRINHTVGSHCQGNPNLTFFRQEYKLDLAFLIKLTFRVVSESQSGLITKGIGDLGITRCSGIIAMVKGFLLDPAESSL